MYNSKPSHIVWIQGLTCNGNSHSFLNYEYVEHFTEHFKVLHHPQLPSPHSVEEILSDEIPFDFLIIEGALSHKKQILDRFDGTFNKTLEGLQKRAKHIICAGSCASYGGIFRLHDEENITGALFAGKQKGGYWDKNDKVINISGCPMHPKWLVETLFRLRENKKVALDEFRRPREVYSYLVHHGCVRNEYFEWKVDCRDYGLKEGCMFYEHGCQGPMTHANCNKILWNKASSKTRVGSGCLGCTEFDFPKVGLFETKKNMSLPATPYGVSKRAYYSVSGVIKSFKIERLEKRLIDEEDN